MRILRLNLNEIPLLSLSSLKTDYCAVKRVGYSIDNGEIDRQATNAISVSGIKENSSIANQYSISRGLSRNFALVKSGTRDLTGGEMSGRLGRLGRFADKGCPICYLVNQAGGEEVIFNGGVLDRVVVPLCHGDCPLRGECMSPMCL